MAQSDHLKVLASVPTEMEADVIVAALDARGIEATATGGFTSGFKAEAPGMVKVLVKSDDLETARQALAETVREMKDIDWSKIDLGEPEA